MNELEKLSIKRGDVLLVRTPMTHIPATRIDALTAYYQKQADEIGCKVLVVDSDVDVTLIPDVGAILQRVDALTVSIERMAQVNQGMVDLFVQTLADEAGEDEITSTYLNGDPIN